MPDGATRFMTRRHVFAIKVAHGESYPDRELRGCLRAQMEVCCGQMEVDVMASDDGVGPRRNSAHECPMPGEGPRRFPLVDMIELELGRFLRTAREGWPEKVAYCLAPAGPWSRWYSKLRSFDTVLRFPRGAPLSTHR